MQSDSGQQFVCALPSKTAYTVSGMQPGSIDWGTNLYLNNLNTKLQEAVRVTPVAETPANAKVCLPIYNVEHLNLMYKDNIFDGGPMFAIPKMSLPNEVEHRKCGRTTEIQSQGVKPSCLGKY